MKKQSVKSLVIVAILIAASSQLIAADFDFEVTSDFFSKYIWRGQNLNDDYVFQPGAIVTFDGFTAGIWASMDTTDYGDNSGEATEVDYYLDYSSEFSGVDGIGYSVGVINYHFPSIAGDTTEVYWGLSFDLPLSPSVTVYHDIDEAEGAYASFALSHDFGTIAELSEGNPIGMEFGASLGWGDSDYNSFYWGESSSGLNDLSLSLSFSMELLGWTFSPSANYVTLVNSELRRTDAFRTESDYFFTGLSLSKSF